MPQPAIQSSNIPSLPAGYVLDASGVPPLPPGYSLDAQAVTTTLPGPTQEQQSYRQRTAAGPFAPAGGAEKAMGEGRTKGQILSDAARAPALAASVAAPFLTGGASLPIQMAVGAGSGAAQSALEGGSNKEAAVSGALGAALPGAGALIGRLKSLLPNAERAGQAFQGVNSVVGKHTVAVTPELSNSLMNYQHLVDAGGSRSLAVSKLLNRLTSPSAGPLNYEEARLFSSNISRLSADEMQRLTPVMRRAVGQIANDLNGTISSTAEAGGQLATYQAAMKEYSQAKDMASKIAVLKKYGIRAGLAGLGGGALATGGHLMQEVFAKK